MTPTPVGRLEVTALDGALLHLIPLSLNGKDIRVAENGYFPEGNWGFPIEEIENMLRARTKRDYGKDVEVNYHPQ